MSSALNTPSTPIDQIFANVPDVTFCVADSATLQAEYIADYEQAYFDDTQTQITLEPASKRRLLLLTQCDREIQLRSIMNFIGRSYFLKYATGSMLDLFGANYGARGLRNPAQFAICTLQFTLGVASVTSTLIAAGTIAQTANGLQFATLADLIIPANTLTGSTQAQAAATGQVYNGYLPGQVNVLGPWTNGFTVSVTNTDTTDNGNDVETDDLYRYRLWLLPDSFPTTGAENAYIFWARTASDFIQDISVYSKEELLGSAFAGQVGIVVLMNGGNLPTTDDLAAVSAATSARTRRPLAIQVIAEAPTIVNYDINVQYWVGSDNAANLVSIEAAVTAAVQSYITWQKSLIGLDINPDKLRGYILAAGAKRMVITSPVFTVLNQTQSGQASTNVTVTMVAVEDE